MRTKRWLGQFICVPVYAALPTELQGSINSYDNEQKIQCESCLVNLDKCGVSFKKVKITHIRSDQTLLLFVEEALHLPVLYTEYLFKLFLSR
jgi:hypothetical protein